MSRDFLFWMFGAIWIALGIATYVFHRRAAYRTKQRWHVFIDFGLSILFAAFGTYWIKGSGVGFIALMWIVCLGISIMNWRFVWFCQNCNATVWPAGLARATVCTKCGNNMHGSSSEQ